MDRMTIDDVELSGKRILTRVDFNVPLDGERVTDDTRIRAALPTIQKITQAGGKCILMSHLGRPKGGPDPKYSIKPAAKRLGELLDREVQTAPDCVGDEVKSMVDAMQDGEVLMLENVRFHKEEEKNDPAFAAQLAALGEVYINDAFGSAHRAHASTAGVAKILKTSAAGYLMKAELESLSRLLNAPQEGFVVILGGAKVGDKITVIHNLITRASDMLIGGGMAYTFLKMKKIEIGKSLFDAEHANVAYNILQVAENANPRKRCRLLLPTDHVVADTVDGAGVEIVADVNIASGKLGADIGPNTTSYYASIIRQAKTIFWNGPMGIFEKAAFAKGTMEIAKAVAEATARGAFSVVGGGDSVAALAQSGLSEKISHVSTGGGASLEFMSGIDLPGVEALAKAAKKV
jgi:phosphoglycerate kinase